MPAKLERSVHAEWMKTDPTYPQRFTDACDKFTQKVEDTLHLVGVHGVERPILHKGKQVFVDGKPLFENKRSEMILMRIAEARMPEKYKPRVEQTNLLDIDPNKLTPEVLDKLADHLIAKALKEKGMNTPEKVAEISKRLEAGETITEEDLEREAGEPKE
jgi:lipoate-protein ligase A